MRRRMEQGPNRDVELEMVYHSAFQHPAFSFALSFADESQRLGDQYRLLDMSQQERKLATS